MSNHYTRRQFIKTSGSAIAAASITPLGGFKAFSSKATDTINFGVIGCRSMGGSLLNHALNFDNTICGGICDVDNYILEETATEIEGKTGKKPAAYKDYRKLLENKDLDAIFIATPDHWHCLQTVQSLEAGKHVYVEKPLANTITECKIIERATKRYGKIVQVGQQQRSGQHWMDIVNLIQSGRLGKIRDVKIWANFNYGQGPEKFKNESVPNGVDYDMWLGPAPKRPFNRNRFHGSWRFQWEYGGGLMTDYGTHLLDIPLWALNIEASPKSVSSIGGIYSGRDRAIEMADTQSVFYEFEDFNMVWGHNGGIETGPYDRHYGIAFTGNNGTLIVNRDGWELRPEESDGLPIIEPISFQEGVEWNHDTHVENFFNAIRYGTELYCPVEAGSLSALYAHFGNIAYQSGEKLKWNDQQRLINEDKFLHYMTPEYRSPWKLPNV